MVRDALGYLVPSLDAAKCVKCGLCLKTCPVVNVPVTDRLRKPTCLAVKADDEIRRDSSSGGAFSLLAAEVLSNRGHVCGVVLDDDFQVRFKIVSSLDDLPALRRSKYVQADTGNVFRDIGNLLTKGELVLFVGTPCQVAGLRRFLRVGFENLITVDLVCHGAPSQFVFDKYLEDTFGKKNLSDFAFRTKEYGYNCVNAVATKSDGMKCVRNVSFDYYEKVMHRGIALKDVCNDCPFAEVPRQGDLTIGDFWGLVKLRPDLTDPLGTSVVLVNSDRGRAFLERVRSKMKECVSMPFAQVSRLNRFRRHMRPHPGRASFFAMLPGQTFSKAAEYAASRRFDIGLVGLWYGRNYGSICTYFALHRVLTEKLHKSVLMVSNPLAESYRINPDSPPYRVANKFYEMSEPRPLSRLYELNLVCDTFMVGSDQLWNIYLSRPCRLYYYLDFARPEKKKIAYGTSFGIPYAGTAEERVVHGEWLKRFDALSVRDRMSVEICADTFGIGKVEQVCDPAFLCTPADYEKMIGNVKIPFTGSYGLVYVLDPNPAFFEAVCNIAKATGRPLVVVLNESPRVLSQNVKIALAGGCELLSTSGKNLAPGLSLLKKVDVPLWLKLFSAADFVITDSFHGTVFSIIYEKPFLSLENPRRGAERFVSLLAPIGLVDRLHKTPAELLEHMQSLSKLDYTKSRVALDAIRTKSFLWLQAAVNKEK